MSDRKEPREITAEEAEALSVANGLKLGNEPGSKQCIVAQFTRVEPVYTVHTPGPWAFIGDDDWLASTAGATQDEQGNWRNLKMVIDCAGCDTNEAYVENPFDKALIKHAPELLAIAKHLFEQWVNGRVNVSDFDDLHDAIKKATTKEE